MATSTSGTVTSGYDLAPDSEIFDYDAEQRSRGQDDDGLTWRNSESHLSRAHDVPRYIPPHQRRVNLDQGDLVVLNEHAGKPDLMGNDNPKYRKLYHALPYSLPKETISSLTARFPSVFFASKDHVNHTHPVSHGSASVSWRFACRRIPRGSRILDVYGDPSAARAFNASQAGAREPKVMRCLVDLMCPADFNRAINKWGPRGGDVDGDLPLGEGEYDRGALEDVPLDYLANFDVFMFNHTAYYIGPHLLWKIFRARPDARVLINTLRHDKEVGTVNAGEFEYKKRAGLVRQRATVSGETYYHPDITPFWFGAKRHYLMPGEEHGFAWEVIKDCEDNWRIEVNIFERQSLNIRAVNWELAFEEADALAAPSEVNDPPNARPDTMVMTRDGRFLNLQIVSWELVEKLRLQCVGKSRKGQKGRELLARLFDSGRMLIQPSTLLPGAVGFPCPAFLLADHVLYAWMADISRETDIYAAADLLKPVVSAHAHVVDPSLSLASIRDMELSEIVTILRGAAVIGLKAATVVARPGLKNALSALNSLQ